MPLLESQMKRLPLGEYPNHRLFGPNDQVFNKDTKQLNPIYRNRRQQRRAKYAKTPKRIIYQEIKVDKGAIKKAIEMGEITTVQDAFVNGKIKPEFKKRIRHYPENQKG